MINLSKVKNVTTKHFIGEIPKDGGEVEYFRLAEGILEVGGDNEEETEEFAYYSGDGTPQTEVMSVKKNHPFEGHFIASDPAQKMIDDREFATGDESKLMYKQERSDGKVLEGPATLNDVNVTGGPAEEYRPISGVISWDQKPEITKKGDDSDGGGGGVEG